MIETRGVAISQSGKLIFGTLQREMFAEESSFYLAERFILELPEKHQRFSVRHPILTNL